MSKGMLGNLKLAEVLQAVDDLWGKLAGDDGQQWLTAFKRFLRKEPTWVPQSDAVNPPVAAPEPPAPRWRKVSTNVIDVNLDAPPTLPFVGALVEWITPGQTGWVRVQRKSDKLYVGGREVVLHLVEAQKTSKIKGIDLRRELQNKKVLHPNVLDALFENTHLIPESWKQDEQGSTHYIYFWAVGFRGSYGGLCVRCLYWLGGRWYWGCDWLGCDWGGQNPAALAS